MKTLPTLTLQVLELPFIGSTANFICQIFFFFFFFLESLFHPSIVYFCSWRIFSDSVGFAPNQLSEWRSLFLSVTLTKPAWLSHFLCTVLEGVEIYSRSPPTAHLQYISSSSSFLWPNLFMIFCKSRHAPPDLAAMSHSKYFSFFFSFFF